MKAAPTLLQRWEDALVFRIGENDVANFDQIPDPQTFPDRFPSETPFAHHLLGLVLGAAVLKLYRCPPYPAGASASLDPCGSFLIDAEYVFGEMSRDERGIGAAACMQTLGRAIEMAMTAPLRLPILLGRIDALDNETLHKMSMEAVQGIDANADIFEGLYR